jgi:hypothetical protein
MTEPDTKVRDLLDEQAGEVRLDAGLKRPTLRRARRRRVAETALTLAVVAGLATGGIVALRELGPRTVPAGQVTPNPTPTGPSTTTGRVGFVGLPPEGAHPSTPPTGRLVISLNGYFPNGVNTDLYVYADGTMIWQKWSSPVTVGVPVPVGVPEGANEFTTGYLQQRLTPRGVELLRSRILSTGLFEHTMDLRHETSVALTIGVRRGDRVVLVSAADYVPEEDQTQDFTPAMERALMDLETALADPATWLPNTVWADREIRAYVASRYSGGFDRRTPSASEFPKAAADLLFGRQTCRDFTFAEARVISKALDDAGFTYDGFAHHIWLDGQLAYEIYSPSEPSPAVLHFWPVIPGLSDFQGWGEGEFPTC